MSYQATKYKKGKTLKSEQEPSLRDNPHEGIRWLTLLGKADIIGRTLKGVEPPTTVEDFIINHPMCYKGVLGNLAVFDNQPESSPEYQQAVEDGNLAIMVYEPMLNPVAA